MTTNSSSSSSSSCHNSITRSSDSCLSFSRLSLDDSTENVMHIIKPHRSSDSSVQAIRSASFRRLGFRDFSLIRQIGCGDIGKVYLCRLKCDDENNNKNKNKNCCYAMKVVNKDVLALKKKMQRAETELYILKLLDHPFLPTLHAEFEASQFSCVVMEYCPGGDLHSLRHKQPQLKFSISTATFYAAEVLVALEYLHMLGIIYRDLKPENILVRSDGHIMLTDFDLSLCSDSIAAIEPSDFSTSPSGSPVLQPHRIPNPFSCLPYNRLFRSKKIQTLSSDRVFVAEPVTARSCSFVGTHEYVAPEVASGMAHGSAVDWWAFGIFLYEMIYGRTPFAGATNESTLRSIVKQPLTFPNECTTISKSEMRARDLISDLLKKDPGHRLGSKRGAAEVKTHPFFKGLNFALIRTMTPPDVPGSRRKITTERRHDGSGRTTAPFDFF